MVLSQHCITRTTQRSISARQIAIVMKYGRSCKHRENIVYYMLNKNIRAAVDQGFVKKQEADKLKNIFVVLNKSNNEVVTTYRPNRNKQKSILKNWLN